MSCTKARLPRLLNTIMQTLLTNSSWSTKITGNVDTLYELISLYENDYLRASFVFGVMLYLYAILCAQLQRRT
jgi:hypothetical protein